jgi:hypothetical protein
MQRYEASPGEDIRHAAEQMVEMFADTGKAVTCSFNEIELALADSGTTATEIVAYYNAESKRRSDEYNARPETIAAREEGERKDKEKRDFLAGALAVAEPLKLTDAAIWQSWIDANKDGYGGRIIRYAEEWARLMQTHITNGSTLAECAAEDSHVADDDGITGFMYGAAVAMLSKCWVHGEELRRWHNHETQISTEGDEANETGGVLNPACLVIG